MSFLFRPRTGATDLAGPSKPLPGGAAGDAAAAAEFAAKRYVWIPDKEAGYLSAWVVREEDGGEISVCSLLDGQVGDMTLFCRVQTHSISPTLDYRCETYPQMI